MAAGESETLYAVRDFEIERSISLDENPSVARARGTKAVSKEADMLIRQQRGGGRECIFAMGFPT